MFYCDHCADQNEWPKPWLASYGPCEVCGRVRSCYDVPSTVLPPAKKKEDAR